MRDHVQLVVEVTWWERCGVDPRHRSCHARSFSIVGKESRWSGIAQPNGLLSTDEARMTYPRTVNALRGEGSGGIGSAESKTLRARANVVLGRHDTRRKSRSRELARDRKSNSDA